VLADGTTVKILNVEDDHSRYCVASTAMSGCTGAATLAVLAAAATLSGWPARFWSDNATAFKATLATALAPIGVIASHNRPYRPQGNGKIERFHQTLHKWLTKQPRAATIDELHQQLDQFRDFYNTQRPHRALRRRVPADVWTDAPKDGPSTRPLNTASTVHDSLVRRGRCHAGRRYHISVGAAHNGTHALTIITGTACHVFIDGHLVRQLTLNPDKRAQPLYKRTGRPPTIEREDPRHA
jgi:Integrase core domain